MRELLAAPTSAIAITLASILALGTLACRDQEGSQVGSKNLPASSAAADAAPTSPSAGQRWTFNDPPKVFGSVVEIIEVRPSERCNGLARVRVRDIENNAAPFQFWISLPHLERSLLKYEGDAASGEDIALAPGSESETGSDLPCSHLEKPVSHRLLTHHIWRSVE